MAGATFNFVRNVVLARLLMPEDYAVAIAMATVASLADIIADLGWERYILHLDHEINDAALAVIHRLKLITGYLCSAIVLVVGPLMAMGMERPDSVAAFALLALVPIIRARSNAGMKIAQRHYDFRQESIAELTSRTAELLVALCITVMFKTYWAMTIALVCSALVATLVSRRLSPRLWQSTWQPAEGQVVLCFGKPLLYNNIMVFACAQIDRVVIALFFTGRQFANYGTTVAVTAGVAAVTVKLANSLLLPHLRGVGGLNEGQRRTRFVEAGNFVGFIAIMTTLGVIMAGPFVVRFAFGGRYGADAVIFAAVAATLALQLIRTWPINYLIARGRTATIPSTNFLRLVGVPLAILAGWLTDSLLLVSLSLTIGEAVGLIGLLLAVARQEGWTLRQTAAPLGSIAVTATMLAAFMLKPEKLLLIPLMISALFALLSKIPAIISVLSPAFRRNNR